MHHAAARQSLIDAAQRQRRRWIHPITLAESLVERARVDDHVAHAGRIRALGITTSALDDEAPLRLAQLRTTTGLPLPDCCVVDAARQNDAAVLSFDDRLRAAATNLGIAVVPESLGDPPRPDPEV